METSGRLIVMSSVPMSGSMVVLGKLSYGKLYEFLLQMTCSDKLKFWLACNAVRNFPGITSEDLFNLYGDFIGVSATCKVNISGSITSRITKLMFSTLSPNHDLVKEALAIAQFEISRNLTVSTISDATDLLFIYDMTINNCCLFSAAGCDLPPTPHYYREATVRQDESKLPTDVLLKKVQKKLSSYHQ